ncbi:hypothetical protein XELAEV_18027125mg [Xenopus laevis]|uniref:Discoidin, CUB and LCCL domain-containing protein 1 n=1 Tax=Xenopus laevis TaxID=8355 RepID=A0A974CXK0_XENLA|nr:hypothetical protein XELAEV_18027125mg [Xenopus laevis]
MAPGRGICWAQPVTALLALLGISVTIPALLVVAESLGDGCGHVMLYEESGTLTSKNYPGTYPNQTLCEITLKVQTGKNLYIMLADVDIESRDCESAYLKIFKGTSFEEIASYCGDQSTIPKEIFLNTNEATIRFESGIHVSGRGFLLNYASSDHPDLITCLARSNHYKDTEYSRYCPAGCKDIAGDISGDVVEGYRDTSLLCKSAIHAGVISDELGGQIQVNQRKGISRYRGFLANGILSKDGSLSDRRVVFSSPDCSLSLTLGFGKDKFSATSSYRWKSETGEIMSWLPERAQLNTPGISWASDHQSSREWLEIDLGEKRKITVFLCFSFQRLEGNLNYVDRARNNFIPPIVGRYLRITPQAWNERIALKVELVGCHLAQTHNSSTHPMWKKTSGLNKKPPVTEEKTITELVPAEESNVGWKIFAIIIPIALAACVLIAGVCFCATKSKKLKTEAYKSPEEQNGGCWKPLDQPIVRQQSTEFIISYNNDKDPPQKFDLVKCDLEDYQQPAMIGTGLVTRKGSTFKPMDTEAKETMGSQEIENHYDCPHRNRHEYALPLTNSEPEYATPIIERHLIRGNAFTPESGYNVPVISLDRKNSFSAVSFSISTSPENSGGDYQTPHCINTEECDYDRPKVYGGWAAMGNDDYQKPQICSIVADGYSSPRDCLKPINQTAITSLL